MTTTKPYRTTYRNRYQDPYRVYFTHVRDDGRRFAVEGSTAPNLPSAARLLVRHADGRDGYVVSRDENRGGLVFSLRDGQLIARDGSPLTHINTRTVAEVLS
jgi:hypothetical protein